MRAIVVTRFGGPEVLELQELPEPAAGAGELLVELEATGVNFRDIYEREGEYGGTPPLVAGAEGAARARCGRGRRDRLRGLRRACPRAHRRRGGRGRLRRHRASDLRREPRLAPPARVPRAVRLGERSPRSGRREAPAGRGLALP